MRPGYMPCGQTGGATKGACGAKTRLAKNVQTCPYCASSRRAAAQATEEKLRKENILSDASNLGGNWANYFEPGMIKTLEVEGEYPTIDFSTRTLPRELDGTALHIRSKNGGDVDFRVDACDVENISINTKGDLIEAEGRLYAKDLTLESAETGAGTIVEDINFPGGQVFAGEGSSIRNIEGVGDLDETIPPRISATDSALWSTQVGNDMSLTAKGSEIRSCSLATTSALPERNGFVHDSNVLFKGSGVEDSDFVGDTGRNLSIKDCDISDSEFVASGKSTQMVLSNSEFSNCKVEYGGNTRVAIYDVEMYGDELVIPTNARLMIPEREDGGRRYLDFGNARYVPPAPDQIGSTAISPRMIVADKNDGDRLTMFGGTWGSEIPVKDVNGRYELDLDREGAGRLNIRTPEGKARAERKLFGHVNAIRASRENGQADLWNDMARANNSFMGHSRERATTNYDKILN